MLQFVFIGFLGTAVSTAFVFTLATGGGALKPIPPARASKGAAITGAVASNDSEQVLGGCRIDHHNGKEVIL